MAKKSMVARDVKRVKIARKYAVKRAALKAVIDDRSASIEQIHTAMTSMSKSATGCESNPSAAPLQNQRPPARCLSKVWS